jgi:peptide/nickel transport system ATP-binding protein/oligopeptide transport system ATP-binding protein
MLLEVTDLRTRFVTRDLDDRPRIAEALNGVSFALEEGRILGLVGESGAGKSLTVTSILGLLRAPARVVGGRAMFEGQDLLALSQQALGRVRGSRIGLVVQSPRSALDPLSRIGDQLVRVQRVHRDISRCAALARAEAMLASVGIPDPRRRLSAWPHELSGGMAQRVVIALALINEPQLLVADEPTTGLDVTVQAQILDLLHDHVRRRRIGAIVITHDLGVVAQYCDDVAVLFAGQVMEQGPVGTIFAHPGHPYTRALLDAVPERLRLGAGRTLGGAPPDLYALPEGCLYRERCPIAAASCRTAPPLVAREGATVRCHFADGAP